MLDSSKRQILTQLLVSLAAIGGLVILLILIGLRLDQSIISVSAKKSELDFREAGSAELEMLLNQAEQAKTIGDKLDKLLPNQEQAAKFAERISSESVKNKVAAEIKPGDIEAPETGRPGELILNLIATGAYTDLVNVLKSLEKNTAIPFMVTAASLTRQTNQYKMEAKIKVFFK